MVTEQRIGQAQLKAVVFLEVIPGHDIASKIVKSSIHAEPVVLLINVV